MKINENARKYMFLHFLSRFQFKLANLIEFGDPSAEVVRFAINVRYRLIMDVSARAFPFLVIIVVTEAEAPYIYSIAVLMRGWGSGACRNLSRKEPAATAR